MQTITVSVLSGKNATIFSINGKPIATVSPDFHNKGKFSGSFQPFGNCDNAEFPDAVEFVSDCISRHFNHFGLDVKFA